MVALEVLDRCRIDEDAHAVDLHHAVVGLGLIVEAHRVREAGAPSPDHTDPQGELRAACLALHDKEAPDRPFLAMLPMLEHGAGDERNFVKKAVSWALRSVGRRNAVLYPRTVAVAQRLAAAKEAAPRWVGKDVLRELMNPKVRSRLAAPRAARPSAKARPAKKTPAAKPVAAKPAAKKKAIRRSA